MSGIPGIEGKWWLVTGGTKGIGHEVALALARNKGNVILTSRKQDEAEAVAKDLAKLGVRAVGLASDVSDLAQVKSLFERVRGESAGRFAGACFAATYPVVPRLWDAQLHEFTDEEMTKKFDEVMSVDLGGARACAREAVRLMLAQGTPGSLVFFGSTPALAGYKGYPYTEAKAGVLGLTKDLAKGYGGHAIRSNALAPGNIQTGWTDGMSDAQLAELASESPLGRMGKPAEVANVALFLLSDLSSFVNGQTLVVDGGTECR